LTFYSRFLLAWLYAESLEDKIRGNDVRRMLVELEEEGRRSESLANKLDLEYGRTMERIKAQSESRRCLAISVLSWITRAKTRLTVAELQHALATQKDNSHIDPGEFFEQAVIVSVCAGLVSVNERDNVVLAHHTMREYFERKGDESFPNADAHITANCVTYLSMDAFSSGICETWDQYDARLKSNPLYKYASCYWGYHARDAAKRLDSLAVMNFLRSPAKVVAAAQALWSARPKPRTMSALRKLPLLAPLVEVADLELVKPSLTTGLHLAAYFGVEEAVREFVLDDGRLGIDVQDDRGRTPLLWAVKSKHEPVVCLLLENGANANAEDATGQTALGMAAVRGDTAIATALLEKSADVDARADRRGRTALMLAAQSKTDAMVKLLLERGARLDARDDVGHSALYHITRRPNEAIRALLVENGIDADDGDAGNAQSCPFNFDDLFDVMELGGDGLDEFLSRQNEVGVEASGRQDIFDHLRSMARNLEFYR
jgi:hypothetical protein